MTMLMYLIHLQSCTLLANAFAPQMILNTHKHGDHTGGNLDIKATYENLQIFGPSKDGPIPGMTHQVDAGKM